MLRGFAFELKSLTQQGTFEGLASTYGGRPDEQNDIVEPGAFTRTLRPTNERPLYLQHKDPIGTVQLTDSRAGLVAEGKLSLGLQKAQEAYIMLKDGIAKSLSIGFEIVQKETINGVRHLREIKLWEISIVVMPANPNAQITAVKSAEARWLSAAIDEATRDIIAAIKRK